MAGFILILVIYVAILVYGLRSVKEDFKNFEEEPDNQLYLSILLNNVFLILIVLIPFVFFIVYVFRRYL